MLIYAILLILATGLASWSSIFFFRERARQQEDILEHQHHHTHEGVIPRIGGIGMILGFSITFGFCWFLSPLNQDQQSSILAIYLGALASFTLGYLDDRKGIRARSKLGIQILIAIGAYVMGLRIERFVIPFTDYVLEFEFIGMLITILWFVALMNLINLIDGLDGLAGGIGLFLMLLLAYLAHDRGFDTTLFLSLGMVGAIIGFLFHNFPPAKVYMGDSGAYLIGFVIAALSLLNSEKGAVVAALLAPVLALALPIADVMFAILRRGLKGLPMFRADRGHIHHRLIRTGLSHRQTVLFLYAVSLLALVGGILAFAEQGRYLPIFIGFIFVIILVTLRGQNITASSLQNLLYESMQSRQDARNALQLKNWFLAEVERADSGKNLWTDYHFILRKMGFCRATLKLNGQERSFRLPGSPELDSEYLWSEVHVLRGAIDGRLTLYAEKDHFSERQFSLISDLGAEAWTQAAIKWRELNDCALDFDAEASAPTTYGAQKARNLYRPSY